MGSIASMLIAAALLASAGEPDALVPNRSLSDPTESPTQGGDTLASAQVIAALPYSGAGTTVGYSDDYEELCQVGGRRSPDVVYAYSPATSVTVDISLCRGSDFDTKLFVYEDVAGRLVACNDDACATVPFPWPYVSKLTDVALEAGHTYYIVVDGYQQTMGAYTLDVTVSGPGYLTGDANCSGGVDNEDIDPFVLALVNASVYRARYPECNILSCDTNCDGFVDNEDVDGFVRCLVSGCASCP